MDIWENSARWVLGLAILTGIPVVALFLLGFWLRGRTGWTRIGFNFSRPTGIPGSAGSGMEPAPRTYCWQVQNCPAERRVACPAFERRYLPCWLANQLAHGELKRECSNCALYDLRKAA
jgi:hypothetical protein